MNCIGWLSPSGELIPCEGHAHLDMAQKIANDLGIIGYTNRIDDVLLTHGWVRISRMTYGDCGLAFWMPNNLTYTQRSFLEEIVNEGESISEKGIEQLQYCHIIE